jgi:hypothetical protein
MSRHERRHDTHLAGMAHQLVRLLCVRLPDVFLPPSWSVP